MPPAPAVPPCGVTGTPSHPASARASATVGRTLDSLRPVRDDDADAGDGGAGRLEFHLFLPQMRLSLEELVARARAAEAAGFGGIALMDHLAPPAAPGHPMYEALTAATWLAAHTERLSIGHLVLCDAFRHPAVLARQAVTLDHASGGRYELGLGSGSVPAELSAFGLEARPGPERVARLGETLEVLSRLFTGEPVDFAGRFFTLEGAQQLPVPTRHIPVVLGGTGPRTMELVGRYADWWNVPSHQADRRAATAGAAGRARVSVQQMVTFVADPATRAEVVGLAERRFGWMGADRLLAGTGPELAAHFASMAADGVERVYAWFTDFAVPGTLEAFGAEVVAALR